jgi:hypothetical protein
MCAISQQSTCDMGYRKKNIRTYFIPIQRSLLHPQPTNICNNDILMGTLEELAAYADAALDMHGASFRVLFILPRCFFAMLSTPLKVQIMQQSTKHAYSGFLFQCIYQTNMILLWSLLAIFIQVCKICTMLQFSLSKASGRSNGETFDRNANMLCIE